MKDMQMQLLDKPDWLKVVERTNINQDKKTYHIWNTYSLNMGRLEDLRKIQKIRQDGYKEILTYLYRNYCYLAGYSEEETFNMLIEFNNNFDNPRPLNKLDGDTKHLARKQYIHRSSSILEILDIEPKDEKNLNLTVTESAVEKRRRKITKQKEQYYQEIKKQGKCTRNEKVDKNKEKIKDLRLKGLKIKDIVSQTGFGESTVKRYISNLKKEGLI